MTKPKKTRKPKKKTLEEDLEGLCDELAKGVAVLQDEVKHALVVLVRRAEGTLDDDEPEATYLTEVPILAVARFGGVLDQLEVAHHVLHLAKDGIDHAMTLLHDANCEKCKDVTLLHDANCEKCKDGSRKPVPSGVNGTELNGTSRHGP